MELHRIPGGLHVKNFGCCHSAILAAMACTGLRSPAFFPRWVLRLFSPLVRYLDKWIPRTIFAAPRNSSLRGGASYNNRKAA
jgi:hypothetical protein